MNDALSLMVKVSHLAKLVTRLPISTKKDQHGVSQKDKRVLNNKVESIYKELIVLNRTQREESTKER
tara:strand:+ start:3387 stop:3587 length:201 start_codon:yes stop_codon:yes gene_type:complete